ncbi:ROK family protein [Sanguibacter antarcticus]|uniref:Putative NBD/HSP70 family sugar kinase n=1 Tax=Sanguibacter antarcticus TaxID=372484 RepID=A0A2A9E6S2_9MICO|nr:ROK family protein [Sanguibacter antarcticus]PFG34251.1 putative NBD/HSP70 family sugar kinase [Sanguibacter antarcticus]
MDTSPAVGQHSLREQNLAVVAREIFAAHTPPSRAEVATATGLTRATVSALVDRLIESHIVAELAPTHSRRAGRPAVPLVPASATLVGIGLEINVDYLSGTVLDLTGATLASITAPGDFHASDPARTLRLLGDLTADLLAHVRRAGAAPRIAGVRLALPGLVESQTSTLRTAPNLGWADLSPLDTSAIAAHVDGAPITLANEANLAALAQLSRLRTDDSTPDSFLYVSADVGIGAAIVLDRGLFLGGRGWSGELGHVVVDPAGPACSCGATGCLEQYAGTDALLRAARLPRGSTIADLVDAVSDCDAAAVAALDRAGHALGAALADFVNLIDVPTILLGGAYSELADLLEQVVLTELTTRVLAARWSTFAVHRAPVGTGAATIGGARQALADVVSDPTPWLAAPRPPG